MPYVTDTAYPRLKAHPTAKELDEIYTPNLFEVVFAEEPSALRRLLRSARGDSGL